MPYTKDEACAKVTELVAHFRQHQAELQSAPEAQIENDYIRPLFRYLNWNVDNVGLREPEWEFVLQWTDRKGRPDYRLQLEGHWLLFMDAKRVEYSMRDPRWVNQVYAYAYSTQSNQPARKVDFAILTDFEEFVVLDCTLKAARPEAVNNFRVIDWTCEDFVAQFDTLWELFERDNVLAASREKNSGLWSLYLSPQKAKANRVPPDEAFLADMDDEQDGWRVHLAKDMKRLNPQQDGERLTAAVQMLIDRLIFIKALSDREIEEDYLAQLADTLEQGKPTDDEYGWFEACRRIFERLNVFYNGSVFEPRAELEAIKVSNKVMRNIVRELLPDYSPYNFAALPVEILGTIYERFLGRVVRTTDHRVKIEEKPEVRKAGGVFYTPQYIVDYIVQQTVGKLLAECKTPEDVAQLKILDPACGSGSFLVGVYETLIEWHKRYYTDKTYLSKQDGEAAYYNGDSIRLTAKLKRQILLNNIFGVDVDAQAVEVTRFALSLKALEDIRRAEVYKERSLFNQKILPDLNRNIQCGNSLIGSDYFNGRLLQDLDDLKRVKPFDWETEFATVMHEGGFDAVIGNPPYIFTRNQKIDEKWKQYFYTHYVHQSSQLNTFGIFVERAYRLLRSGGISGFITPNNWLTIDSFAPLRKFVLGSTRDVKITNILARVFKAADVDTAIVLFTKETPTTLTIAELQDKHEVFAAQVELSSVQPPAYIIQISLLKDASSQQLLQRIETNVQPLGQLCTVSTGLKTYQTGKGKPLQKDHHKENRVFHAKTRRNKTYGRYLDGVDVRRYQLVWSGEYLSYGDWLAEPRRSVPFDGERLLVRQIPSKPPYLVHGVFTNEMYYHDINSMVIFATSGGLSLKYVLGLVNSRLLSFWFQKTYDKLQRKIFPQFKVKELASFPIRPINFADLTDQARHSRMITLVEQMLSLHQRLAIAKTKTDQVIYQRQIGVVNKQIDALVYELYNLTAEDIALVEKETVA